MKHLAIQALVCISLSFATLSSVGQTPDKNQVTEAVRNYVDAFYYGDTTKIHQSISPSVVKYGYYIPKDKKEYEGEAMSFKEMIAYAARVNKRGPNPKVAQFPKEIAVYDVLDQTASAKLTAWWGSDYILLAKLNGKWMITHVLWQSPVKN
jgi:Putative lumazine-binding